MRGKIIWDEMPDGALKSDIPSPADPASFLLWKIMEKPRRRMDLRAFADHLTPKEIRELWIVFSWGRPLTIDLLASLEPILKTQYAAAWALHERELVDLILGLKDGAKIEQGWATYREGRRLEKRNIRPWRDEAATCAQLIIEKIEAEGWSCAESPRALEGRRGAIGKILQGDKKLLIGKACLTLAWLCRAYELVENHAIFYAEIAPRLNALFEICYGRHQPSLTSRPVKAVSLRPVFQRGKVPASADHVEVLGEARAILRRILARMRDEAWAYKGSRGLQIPFERILNHAETEVPVRGVDMCKMLTELCSAVNLRVRDEALYAEAVKVRECLLLQPSPPRVESPQLARMKACATP